MADRRYFLACGCEPTRIIEDGSDYAFGPLLRQRRIGARPAWADIRPQVPRRDFMDHEAIGMGMEFDTDELYRYEKRSIG